MCFAVSNSARGSKPVLSLLLSKDCTHDDFPPPTITFGLETALAGGSWR
jgi:hypothetical protein